MVRQRENLIVAKTHLSECNRLLCELLEQQNQPEDNLANVVQNTIIGLMEDVDALKLGVESLLKAYGFI